MYSIQIILPYLKIKKSFVFPDRDPKPTRGFLPGSLRALLLSQPIDTHSCQLVDLLNDQVEVAVFG
jgi:hypothetical protein